MGYRSEVAIVMSNKHYDEFMELADKIEDAKLKENVHDLLEDAGTIKVPGDYTVMHWNWVKWYNDIYPEVTWIEHNLIAPYGKVRIGEESDDIETDFKAINAETDEADYELGCVISPDSSIYISGQLDLKEALHILNSRNYSVKFLTEAESGECDDAKIIAMPAFGAANDVELLDTVDELIDFAKKVRDEK
ncbi:MAG: hypothetical protein IJ709_09110 [Selenomonas sp.]|nr:hypothetical protein [Selenomonas sp.]